MRLCSLFQILEMIIKKQKINLFPKKNLLRNKKYNKSTVAIHLETSTTLGNLNNNWPPNTTTKTFHGRTKKK